MLLTQHKLKLRGTMMSKDSSNSLANTQEQPLNETAFFFQPPEFFKLIYQSNTLSETDKNSKLIKGHTNFYYKCRWSSSFSKLLIEELSDELWLVASVYFLPVLAAMAVLRAYLNWCEFIHSYNNNFNLCLKVFLNTSFALGALVVAAAAISAALGAIIAYQTALETILTVFYGLKFLFKSYLVGYFTVQKYLSAADSDRRDECEGRAEKYKTSAAIALCVFTGLALFTLTDVFSGHTPKIALKIVGLFISGYACISGTSKCKVLLISSISDLPKPEETNHFSGYIFYKEDNVAKLFYYDKNQNNGDPLELKPKTPEKLTDFNHFLITTFDELSEREISSDDLKKITEFTGHIAEPLIVRMFFRLYNNFDYYIASPLMQYIPCTAPVRVKIKFFTPAEILAAPNQFNLTDMTNTLSEKCATQEEAKIYLMNLIANKITTLAQDTPINSFWFNSSNKNKDKFIFLTWLKKWLDDPNEKLNEISISNMDSLIDYLNQPENKQFKRNIFLSCWESTGKTEQIMRLVKAYDKQYPQNPQIGLDIASANDPSMLPSGLITAKALA